MQSAQAAIPSVPEFLLPYCRDPLPDGSPLFEAVDDDTVRCTLDLPACVLFKLCCLEESSIPHRDTHGRFPATSAIAFREGYLNRPIVDEYGLAFRQALQLLLPSWSHVKRGLRVKLSHDIDDVSGAPRLWPQHLPRGAHSLLRNAWMATPWRVRSAVQEATRNRAPLRALRALFTSTTALGLVHALARLSHEYQLDSSFYWKASPVTGYDSGYDPRSRQVKSIISELQDQGYENGVHPGYDTYLCPEKLREEVDIVRAATGDFALGGRQHYLRWCPQTWADWERSGLSYDSSVGFADQVGFRAGTCVPYHPWFFAENRPARLLEVPLIVMDTTLVDREHMALTSKQSYAVVKECVERCRAVGGVFTFLCHNTTIRNHEFLGLYAEILELLTGSERFDWQSA